MHRRPRHRRSGRDPPCRRRGWWPLMLACAPDWRRACCPRGVTVSAGGFGPLQPAGGAGVIRGEHGARLVLVLEPRPQPAPRRARVEQACERQSARQGRAQRNGKDACRSSAPTTPTQPRRVCMHGAGRAPRLDPPETIHACVCPLAVLLPRRRSYGSGPTYCPQTQRYVDPGPGAIRIAMTLGSARSHSATSVTNGPVAQKAIFCNLLV